MSELIAAVRLFVDVDPARQIPIVVTNRQCHRCVKPIAASTRPMLAIAPGASSSRHLLVAKAFYRDGGTTAPTAIKKSPEERRDKPGVVVRKLTYPNREKWEHQIGRNAAAAQPSMVASISPIVAMTLPIAWISSPADRNMRRDRSAPRTLMCCH